jgi:flagellar hook assembly protein FlgD
VNDDMSAGVYRLTWNATDNEGRNVSSGVYIYRLQAGKFVSSKKMLLLK